MLTMFSQIEHDALIFDEKECTEYHVIIQIYEHETQLKKYRQMVWFLTVVRCMRVFIESRHITKYVG